MLEENIFDAFIDYSAGNILVVDVTKRVESIPVCGADSSIDRHLESQVSEINDGEVIGRCKGGRTLR